MQVPALLYGDAVEVRKRCKVALRSWLKSETTYIAAMEASGMHDIADIPAPISLEYGRREGGVGLYLAAPTLVLCGESGLLLKKRDPSWKDSPWVERFFEASLTRPWG